MALNLDSIFGNLTRQFRTVATDARFQDDFRDGINNSLDAMSSAADLSTPLAHIVGYNDSVSGLSEDDQMIVMHVCAFELLMMGRKHVRGDTAFRELGLLKEEALGDFMVKKSRDDQDDVASNLSGEGAQIIGLGDVSDAVSTGTSTSASGTDTMGD